MNLFNTKFIVEDGNKIMGGRNSFLYFFILLLAFGLFSCSPNNKKTQTTSSKKVVEERQQAKKPSMFSVSENKQVLFSKGNLQYQASTKTWRFAQNQTEIIGKSNMNLTSNYEGWIDLFAWGTSGYSGRYPETGMNEDITNIANTNYDWGEYNKIQGDEVTSGWRTPTIAEWEYLLLKRPNASSLFGCARINGLMGLVILPDNFVLPKGITFNTLKMYEEGDPDTDFDDFDYFAYVNDFNSSEWNNLENKGAIFLPAAGRIIYGNPNFLEGGYWSSSGEDVDDYDMFFQYGRQGIVNFLYVDESHNKVAYCVDSENEKIDKRISVRLVRDMN